MILWSAAVMLTAEAEREEKQMDQKKIGNFIAKLRKEKGMTQRELADRLCVSDKTVSKWECGNSLPEITLLGTLCEALDSNVNELLSGEKIVDTEYSKKAEENMMNLIADSRKNGKAEFIFGIILAVVLIILLGLGVQSVGGGSGVKIGYYIDVPSLFFLVLGCLAFGMIAVEKTLMGFLRVAEALVIPFSVMETMIQMLYVLHHVNEITKLGPNVAVALCSTLYALIIYVVVRLIRFRKERQKVC